MAEREPVTRRVVTLSKNVTKGASTHTHYCPNHDQQRGQGGQAGGLALGIELK